jgi:hypothetical protein
MIIEKVATVGTTPEKFKILFQKFQNKFTTPLMEHELEEDITEVEVEIDFDTSYALFVNGLLEINESLTVLSDGIRRVKFYLQ